MSLHENIDRVVADGLCIGCGTCAGVCPDGAIGMEATAAGLLEARVDAASCTSCGLCVQVCPGAGVTCNGFPGNVDPLKGPVRAAYTGFATEPSLRRTAQSGGVATALLLHLLRAGRIRGAVVTDMPDDGRLRPRTRIARTPEALIEAQGSKYCTVAVNEFLAQRGPADLSSLAAVGVSCQVHGLRNAAAALPGRDAGLPLVLGLFCERTLAGAAMDYLIARSGTRPEAVASFRFKSKERRGWPGDVRIRRKDGRVRWVDGRHRLACKDRFTPARCRLCPDKFNVLADLSLGDAWGVREEPEGVSAVLVRSERGAEAVASARRAGVIELRETPPDEIFRGNGIEQRRRAWTAYTRAWVQGGRRAPDLRPFEPGRGDVADMSLRPHHRLLNESLRLRTWRSRRRLLRRARRRCLLDALRKRVRRAAKRLLPRSGAGLRLTPPA